MGALPGQVAYNSTVPFGAQTFDQAAWSAGIAMEFLNGIVDQARTLGGDASRVGLPASWPYGPLAPNAVKADGSVSPLLVQQVQAYVNSPAALNDADFAQTFGAPMGSSLPAGGYIDKPLTVSEQVALANQRLNEQKYLSSLIQPASGSSSGKSSTTSRSSSSGGGSGGGGSDYNLADKLAYLDASTNATGSLAQQEFDLKKELLLLQFKLDNDPNNPQLLLKQQELAEQVRQFNATLALQQKVQQNETAKTIADYGANPGDAVAREYFLRKGANPTGNAVNVFTGQPTGQQLTLSEVMQANAPLVGGTLQGQMTGTPSPPTETTEPVPPPEETPQFAFGTRPEVTRDGWTKADKFITGDHPMGRPNPEFNEVRVRNGKPETRVTPLSKMLGHRKRMPMYASGTDGIDPGASSYAPAPSPWDGYDQPAIQAPPLDFSQPYYKNPYSDAPFQQASYTADPNYGSPYQGMADSDIVTNANSAYYGQTVASAKAAQLNADRSPGLYVVGPTADTPDMYDGGGGARPYVQGNTMADLGILTGAQLSNRATQSANPTLAGYQSPIAPPSAFQPAGNLQNDQINREVNSTGALVGTGPSGSTPTTPTRITQPTTVKSRDGGATYTLLPGDIPSPYETGGFLRYDPAYMDWVPVVPKYTLISSEDQFRSLPYETQQAIFTGQRTGYQLAPNVGDNLLAGYGPTSSPMGQREFLALSPEEQKALINGGPTYLAGSPTLSSQMAYSDIGPLMSFPTGGMVAKQREASSTPVYYENYLTPEQLGALSPPVPITPSPFNPSMLTEPGTGTTTTGTGTTGTTGTGTTPTGTGTGTGTTTTTGTGTTGTGTGTATTDILSQIAQLLGLSYDNQTYQNLPALQYALGNLTGGDYGNVSNEPIEVPGLGLSLPGASSMMNYEMLQNLIQNGSFDLLNSLYTAGNVPLSLILKIAQARAPLGNAYDAGMIETV